MIAVIFELSPHPEQTDTYFELAEQLSATLSKIDGFISVERFQSLSNPHKYLSLSFWRDEQAVKQWRNQVEHRVAQQQGRTSVFDNYRLRIAQVLRDYGLHDRDQAPQDSQQHHK